MTKEELRQSYVDLGWEVAPVAQWLLVSKVEGKEKYDVNCVSPTNAFGTAQVVVDANGAVAEGFWKESDESFTEALRTEARSYEAGATIFAVTIGEVKEADEVGEVTVYKEDGSKETYVVKRRGGTFSHVAIV